MGREHPAPAREHVVGATRMGDETEALPLPLKEHMGGRLHDTLPCIGQMSRAAVSASPAGRKTWQAQPTTASNAPRCWWAMGAAITPRGPRLSAQLARPFVLGRKFSASTITHPRLRSA